MQARFPTPYGSSQKIDGSHQSGSAIDAMVASVEYVSVLREHPVGDIGFAREPPVPGKLQPAADGSVSK